MIISASRRTDIPAFYAEEFMQAIRTGYFDYSNPYFPSQKKRISFSAKEIDVIVFWTKNPKPLMKFLPELDQKGYKYYFQFTLNDYPISIEPNLNPIAERLQTFIDLSKKIGKDKVIWRYDPIIISKTTPLEFHFERIEFLAQQLKNHTNRLVISFVDFYKKALKSLNSIDTIDVVSDLYAKELRQLAEFVSKQGRINSMEVATCSEKVDLSNYGIRHGSCIDGALIQKLFNISKNFPKDKNQRNECKCVQSLDIGQYNTCKSNCTYCYASKSIGSTEVNHASHHE
jgi:ribosomal protein S18